MTKLIYRQSEGRTKRVARRFLAALVAFTLMICNAAPISVWAAVEETEERKAFFSVDEDILPILKDQVMTAYGDRKYLIQNYVFEGTSSIIYDAADDDTSIETDIHDFALNPSQRESIIGVSTYFCEGEPDVELRITVAAEDVLQADASDEEAGTDGAAAYDGSDGQYKTDLAFVTDGGAVSLDELKSAVIKNDDEVTYVIHLGLEELERLSYYIDEPGHDYTLRFNDTDIDIRCISFRSCNNCYAVARGMSAEADYTDSMTQICDIQKAGSAWAAVVTAYCDGTLMLLTDTQNVSFNWQTDRFETSLVDSIDEEHLEKLLVNVREAYAAIEDTADAEKDEDAIIDITEGASMLYLDSNIFIDPEEIKTYDQKVSDLYYDAQINIFGTPMYITSDMDSLGNAEEHLGDVFDSGMAEGTVGIKTAKLENDAVAGKLVMELPEDAQIRFSKGDGTGVQFSVDDVVNGDARITTGRDETSAESIESSTLSEGNESVESVESTENVGTVENDGISTNAEDAEQTGDLTSEGSAQITLETDADGVYADVIEIEDSEDVIGASLRREETAADREEADDKIEDDDKAEAADGTENTVEAEPTDVIEDAEAIGEDELVPVGIVMSYKFLKRASYCAVADDMTICAVYDEDGKLSALADGCTEDDIAAYILLPESDEEVRAERIDFIYSDVVAAEVGQEYAELILEDDPAADAVANIIIDSETKFEKTLGISGIVDEDALEKNENVDGTAAVVVPSGTTGTSAVASGDAESDAASSHAEGAEDTGSDSTSVTGAADVQIDYSAGPGAFAGETSGETSGETQVDVVGTTTGSTTDETVYETSAGTDEQSIDDAQGTADAAREGLSDTSQSAADQSGSSAADSSVFSGGPGVDTSESAAHTEPEVLPDADVPQQADHSPSAGASSYGEYYPSEDSGSDDDDNGSDGDGDTSGDAPSGNDTGTDTDGEDGDFESVAL